MVDDRKVLGKTGKLKSDPIEDKYFKIEPNLSYDTGSGAKSPRRLDDILKSVRLQVMINLEINMKIKKVFVNLIILILNNYNDYYTESSDCSFDYESYVNSMPNEDQEFYRQFVQTQLFNTFIKDSQQELTVEIREFKKYINIITLSKGNEKTYLYNNTLLMSNNQTIATTLSYSSKSIPNSPKYLEISSVNKPDTLISQK